MSRVTAQITTRSGPAGTKDAPVRVHGEYRLEGRRAPRDFMDTLAACLDAGKGVARDGMVTEVSILIFPDTLAK